MATTTCSVYSAHSCSFEPTEARVEVARAALDGKLDSLLAGIKALIPPAAPVKKVAVKKAARKKPVKKTRKK